jgi:hypothetical protein
MKRKPTITETEEDRIIRHAERVDASLVRVECVRSTLPILKKAGFVNPVPFHRYIVPTCYRENAPLLRVAPPTPRPGSTHRAA